MCMGKFDKEVDSYAVSTANEITNYEDGKAYSMSPKLDLYTTISSYLVKEPKFYGDTNEEYERVISLIKQVHSEDPEFVLQLATFARNELYLRSAPILLLGVAAQLKTPNLRQYVPAIVKRADELSEIIAYFVKINGNIGNETAKGMLPNPLRRGLSEVFHRFHRHNFAKYDRNNANVTLQDVIRLVHPVPITEEEKSLYKDIAKDTLGSANTWENKISTKGSTKENWEESITVMPIMATIRNLRNILDKEVGDKYIQIVCDKLSSENTILNSKQFPFRFFNAYREIEDHRNPAAGKLLSYLNRAVDISIKNLPVLQGITAVFADVSGSMTQQTLSKNSKTYPKDIATLYAAITSKFTNGVIGVYADEFRTVNFADQDTVLNRKDKLDRINVGGSTNAYLALRYLNHRNVRVNRILIFSDEESYDSKGYYDFPYASPRGSVVEEWTKYKKSNPNCYLYCINLVGYGHTQVPEDDPRALNIGGWNESIFKYIPVFEENKDTVIDKIKNIKAGDFYK